MYSFNIGIKMKVKECIKNNLRRIRLKYKLDFENMESDLSPIDKHIVRCKTYIKEGHFANSYKEWSMRKINKILSIYDIKYFKDKKILVLGDGIGNMGSFFADIGANVLALEGRKLNVNLAKLEFRNLANFEIKEFDLREDFTKFGKFDIIINFSLIEVMDEIYNLLDCCCKMSNNIFIETLVIDSFDNITYKKNWDYERSDIGLNIYGTFPSPLYIKDFFKKRGYSVVKYRDSELNLLHNACYDWKAKGNGRMGDLRAFWHIKK